MKDFLKIVLVLLVTIILGLLIAYSIVYASTKYNKKEDEKKYNGGICTKCGGHYIYEQAVAHYYDTDYIYICDKCGSMIELDKYRVEGKEE